ncbi:hypothetical protein F0P96_11090 [Hymenobacter busanensis]|uniref:Uncharacterized protein n=1 Tax=Hymenobacter busanensis TaxID=2607656 RepID=A0A7L4ZXJ4_9BACT|nr:hypothetical protein [Hymenobacter busanensis]KAA9332030.1 hypothetical protein F0P96_11090 [Hymenobacter busanensis]QHJ07633.1 hypothetical protein GUY19_10185 [Hymenobacter busanensis]
MLTAKQDNRLTAAENALAALLQDATPYQQDKALQRAVADLQQFADDLTPLRQQTLRKASKGNTTAKTDRRELLATSAGEIAGDLYAYAIDQQDRTLQNAANHNYSSLYDLRATALTDTAQDILDLATEHAEPLAEYGVTKARLTELKEAFSAFSTSKNDPRQQISEGKAARLAIKDKFTQLAALLEDRLDRSLRKYARSHPAFYQRIQAARLVINRPGKQKSSAAPAKLE